MSRVPELDALRGLAAILIVLHHYFAWPFGSGWIAVDLFFVLSGYLITGIILRNGGTPGFLRSFYVRRSLRIWPIYYLTLVGVIALAIVHPGTGDLRGIPYFATFTQFIWQYWSNESEVRYFPALTHTWTLAVEEQFYIFWPALVLLFRRHAVPLAVGVIALSVWARWDGFPLNNLLTRSDGFAFGGLLACLFASGRGQSEAARFAFRPLALIGLGYLIWAGSPWGGSRLVWLPGTPWRDILFVNLAMSAIVGFVVAHSGSSLLSPLRIRWLCNVGLISYGLYLYHFPILFVLGLVEAKFAPGGNWHAAILALNAIVSLAVAIASWHWIEKPVLRLKDRFEYRPTGPSHRDAARP